MDPAKKSKPPRARPLEINPIDHIIRCYGGRTIALDMEPNHMGHAKRHEDWIQYINFLNQKNGDLRLEITFYRECFQHAEKFKDKINSLSQDLLHECIIGLLDTTSLEEIRVISKRFLEAVDELRGSQKKAFDEFIAPYRSAQKTPRPELFPKNGWF
ncbi:hypothetical protein BU23DRAFT_583702 [Bimuria novae-zelandiae CBS 107.79]|uniref:Uncharacterized protein n=1 Tax=Bimuria novae-zelandiae CBS 107.79 TaxID=1447943 RepID=A0A6A5UXR3_9PLEO|nr:hypothetical protein BU23DRAFT_583702 [Bimuria novae-zelandiae CBS 107.79]